MSTGTKLTREDIESIVVWWKPRLGLSHWQIEVVWERQDDENYETGNHAWCWRSKDYDRARIGVNLDEFHKWSRRRANQIVVHELLHLVTRDVESIVDQLNGMLHRDVDKAITDAFSHHMEGMVDRLATYITDLTVA